MPPLQENAMSLPIQEDRLIITENKTREIEQESSNEEELMVTDDSRTDDQDTDMRSQETSMEVAENDSSVDPVEGVSASMHAPIEVATHMKVDTAKEMLAMMATKPARRKLPATSRS